LRYTIFFDVETTKLFIDSVLILKHFLPVLLSWTVIKMI